MKLIKKNSCVEVTAVGGLGNQLFCYAAGLYLAEKTKTQLVVNVSQIGVGAVDHGKTIINFGLDCVFKNSSNAGDVPGNFLNRFSQKLAFEFNLYRRLYEFFSGRYIAKSVGYESEFMNISTPRILSGYFQTYIYADIVKSQLLKSVQLINESVWFQHKIFELNSINPIIIHMRRGDYLKAKSDFGVLNLNYYLEALDSLQSKRMEREVWIFTDSPDVVNKEILNSELNSATVIIPPKESTPNESMILMSRATDLVISNSTFSWWSGYLSDHETNVVAPNKWFRGLEDPKKLIPEHWHQVRSQWID